MKKITYFIIYLAVLIIIVFYVNHEVKTKKQIFLLNAQKHYFQFFDFYEFYFQEYFNKNITDMELHVLLSKKEESHYDFYLFSSDRVPVFSTRKRDRLVQPYSLFENIIYHLSSPLAFFSYEFKINNVFYIAGVKKVSFNNETYSMVIVCDQTDVYNSYRAWRLLLFIVYTSIWTFGFVCFLMYKNLKEDFNMDQIKVNLDEFLGNLVNDNRTFTMLLDSSFIIEEISDSILDLLNYNKDEMVGHPISEFIVNKNLYEHMFILNTNKSETQYEIRLMDKNRMKKTFLMTKIHYFDKGNVLNKILLIFQLIDSIIETGVKLNDEIAKNNFYTSLKNIINSNENSVAIMEFVGREAKRFIDFDYLTMYVLDNNTLYCHLTTDPQLKIREKTLKLQIGQGLTGMVAKVKKTLIVNDTRTSHMIHKVEGTDDDDECLVAIPLLSNDMLYGVLNFSRMNLRYFTEKDQRTLEDIANFVVAVFEKEDLKQKLATSEERFLSTINESPLGIIVIKDNNILYTNKQFQEFLNYEEKYLLNTDVFTYINESNKSLFTAQLTSFGLNSDIGVFEIECKDVENKQVFLEMSFSNIDWEGKKCILVSANNITKRKELNEHLLQSQKLDSLGSLTSGIAHDFKNILAGIMGAADLLLIKSDESSQTYNYAKIIKASANRGAGLSMQLLNFSSSRRQENEIFDLNEVLKETTQIINYTFNKNISTEFDLSQYPLHFQGELVKVQQCILNLCVNARDAMPNGGTLKITTKFMNNPNEIKQYWSDAENKAFSYIEISDTGSGISEKIQKQIFNPFFTTKEKNKGTGLGLSTTRGIIVDYNGHITLQSKIGKGTSFIILLPWMEYEKLDVDNFTPGSNIKTHSILLVDDEEIVLEVAKELLEELGCTVYATDSGYEGLDLLSQHPEINLAIIDRIMPKMDGFTLLKKLKESRPDLTVLIASGYLQEADIEEFKQNGASDYILKPYKLEELIKLLNSV